MKITQRYEELCSDPHHMELVVEVDGTSEEELFVRKNMDDVLHYIRQTEWDGSIDDLKKEIGYEED